METKDKADALQSEMAAKAAELEQQRMERKESLVDITLEAIVDRVESQQKRIADLTVEAGKPLSPLTLRQITEVEIIRAADGQLWCAHYSERAKSDQQMNVFLGSHWVVVDSQQWMDFVDKCGERCGLSDALLMDQSFMNKLYEGVAFNLKKHRRHSQPYDEVWLNMQNGTLVVRKDGSVELRNHAREDLFFYRLDYSYDENAECPKWLRFLDRVLPEEQAQKLLGEYLGYCLMRDHRYEKLLWLFGSGQNGKSTALTVIERLFGKQNVSYLSLENLTDDEKKRGMFEHKLLNISSETGRNVNASVMKQIASGEPLTVEMKYQNPRQITDYGKVITATNQMPRAENTFAFYRRFIILPFEQTISEAEKDVHLSEKLLTELPGILNWVIRALIGLMKNQAFTICESSERALDEYKLESDNVILFVKEMLEPSSISVKGTDIFNAYQRFCKDSSLNPLGKGLFYKRLNELTHTRTDHGNVPYFKLKVVES